jgi:hypothetical protein
VEPLKAQLAEVDQAIKDQLDLIAATKTIAEISYITEKNHPRLYNNLHLAFFHQLSK